MAAVKRVFVSYSSHDREVAQRVCQSLEKAGVRCWIAPRDIAPGANWGGSIAEAIDDAVAMVLVFSRNADNSDQIKKELVLAGDARKVVIPARVEDLLPINPSFRYELSSRQWIDLFGDWEAGITRIVERVQQIMPPPVPTEAPAPSPAPAPVSVPVPAAGLVAKSRASLYAVVAVAVAVLAVGGYFVVANRMAPPAPALADKAGTATADTKAASQVPVPAPVPSTPVGESKVFAEALHSCVEAREGGKSADVVVTSCTAAVQTGLGTTSGNSIAYANRASAYNGQHALDEAMSDANRAIELDPKNAFAYWVRAHVYRNLRQFDRAITDFDQYMRLVPKSALAFYWRGNSYLDQGNAERALVDYEEATRIDPNYWPPWQNRCLAYGKLSQYEQALPQCNEAIRLNPQWWGSYQTRGETYAALGKQDLANKDFEEAKRRRTPTPPPPRPQPPTQPARVFYNGNIGGVANGGRPPQFSLASPTRITYVMTYHWNNAKGHQPGTIALVSASGVTYGPWQTTGQPGQGGVPDAYWIANPNVVLPSGVYKVVDSDPASWAQNGESLGLGMTEIKGAPE